MVFTVSIIFLLDQAKTWKSGEIWFCMLVCIYESIKGKKKKRKLGEAGSKDEEKSSSHFLCVT